MRDVSSGSGTKDAQPISPTVGRRWLAQEIRRLRENACLKQGDVAARLRCAQGKIAHMESMRNAISGPDLEIMLPFFGVPAERIDWYLQLADVAKQKGWWDGNQAIPDWFSLYVGLEWGASEIRKWDLGFVPGILQTRDYAAALLAMNGVADERQLQPRLDARLQRQQVLHRSRGALELHAIIDESVLLRAVGGHAVLPQQLEHLIEMAAHPRVTLQVMPLGSGPNRGHLGTFQWMGFPREHDAGVVYVENQQGGLYLEEEHEIEGFKADFTRLTEQSLAPEDTRNLLIARRKEATR